ncbi:MAG: hypothetical protein ACLF0P_15355 [Thermoanaerobaculia bacterium]
MTRPATYALIATLPILAVGLTAFTAAPPAASLAQHIRVEAEISPSTEHEDAYACEVVVTDSATGEVLAAPEVLFRSGEEARARSGVARDGHTAQVDVFASAASDQRTATIRVDLTRDDVTTNLHTVRVKL